MSKFSLVIPAHNESKLSVGIAFTYAAIVLFGVDTGVVFCRSADFTTVGGYDEGRPIGEDVAFLMALRELGKERGQRLIRFTDVKALVSMRKFDQHGDWHFLKMMPTAMQAVLWPSMVRKPADRYWYNDDR